MYVHPLAVCPSNLTDDTKLYPANLRHFCTPSCTCSDTHPTLGLACYILMVYLMFTSLWPLCTLYFIWLVIDWQTPETGKDSGITQFPMKVSLCVVCAVDGFLQFYKHALHLLCSFKLRHSLCLFLDMNSKKNLQYDN